MRLARTVSPVAIGVLLSWLVLGAYASSAQGAGLNTDVALTPPRGGTIIRLQARYRRLEDDPTALRREIDVYLATATVAYGITERIVVLGTLPVVHREVDFGMGGGTSDTGLADIPLAIKYRFYQDDKPGTTTRWAVIGGLEVPTFDDEFSSDSVDPIIGTVWTHQDRDWWLDWDVLYRFNTAGGVAGDDELRADVAYSRRLLHGESESRGPWAFYAIAEVNARYIADGSDQVFFSQGLQYIAPTFILEMGVQIPITQDMQSPRLETKFTLVLSVRFQF